MLKVFLVEDEFIMREGIKKNVPWSSHGYEFCGEAADGEVAFPMIQKAKPDIVITDIHMPFMDGIELSRLIKKEMPWVEIILLTGFQEFAYAQEAIKIGIAQYLSKPINSDELLKELDAVAEKILKRQEEEEVRQRYDLEMSENIQRKRSQFFQELVSGEKSPAELHQEAKAIDIDISALWYNIVLLDVYTMGHDEGFSDEMLELHSQVQQALDGKRAILFDRGIEGAAILFMADDEGGVGIAQGEFLEAVASLLQAKEGYSYFAGVGIPVNRLRSLSDSFYQARVAFARRYLNEGSQVAYGAQAEADPEQFDIQQVDVKQLNRGRITEFLRLGTKEEASYLVESFLQEIGAGAMASTLFRQYILMDIYFCVRGFLEEICEGEVELEAPNLAADMVTDMVKAREYMESILYNAVALREKKSQDRYGSVVQQVIDFIEANYDNEDLSLNMVASHVNFSPNHLSTIFSQQTDQTFIKYLTDYRMTKAKELLRCTGDKSSAISLKVGYKDPHYFSFLFKKTQGVTPTQYRNGQQSE